MFWTKIVTNEGSNCWHTSCDTALKIASQRLKLISQYCLDLGKDMFPICAGDTTSRRAQLPSCLSFSSAPPSFAGKKHPMSVLANLLVNPHNTKMGRRSKRRLNIRSQAVEPSSVESETTMWNKVTEILVGLQSYVWKGSGGGHKGWRGREWLAIHFKDEDLVENHPSLALVDLWHVYTH